MAKNVYTIAKYRGMVLWIFIEAPETQTLDSLDRVDEHVSRMEDAYAITKLEPKPIVVNATKRLHEEMLALRTLTVLSLKVETAS